MVLMKYKSLKGKEIIFDEFTDSRDEEHEDGTIWAEICPSCHNKYRNLLQNRCEKGGSGEAWCSVRGCTNSNASWYVDFSPEEVTIYYGE